MGLDAKGSGESPRLSSSPALQRESRDGSPRRMPASDGRLTGYSGSGGSMSHVRTKWLNWVVVISPTGDLTGSDETDALHGAIQDALARHYQGVVVNAKEVGFATSTAAGVIVTGYSSSQRLGARFAICCVNDAHTP